MTQLFDTLSLLRSLKTEVWKRMQKAKLAPRALVAAWLGSAVRLEGVF